MLLIRPRANLLVSLVTVSALCIAAFLIGPRAESKVFPVLSNVVVKRFDTDNNRLRLMVGATKMRRFCVRLETDFYVDGKGGSQPIIPRVMSRVMAPIGDGQFHTLSIYELPFNAIDRLTIVAHHACHPFWTTRTEIVRAIEIKQLAIVQVVK